MSEFKTKLCVSPATGRDDNTWELVCPLVYQSDVAGKTFTVPAGFVTNFASVPRLPVVYLLCGDTASEAATVHDYLYTMHPVDRATADAVLREASILTGVPGWRAAVMWAGVRVFGNSHWTPGNDQDKTVAADKVPAVEQMPEENKAKS